MKLNLLSPQAWLLLLGCAVVCSSSVGCQTSVGGQTLPSAYYLKDDLSYFPPGPEFKLTKQVQAIEEYLNHNNRQPKPFVWTASVAKILEKVGRCKSILETLH